jgi:predicted TIM-barrel fold metal-dependent hydrolase
MIIEVNAYLGHFAFRRLRHNTAAPLLALMDSKRIDKAVVSSASAITYRNAQAGNEEVAEEVRGHRDRLIPFAVINPFYAGWRDDLKICHEGFGMAGLRLYPKWPNYQLSSACCRELVNAATERGMVITIFIRVEDNRGRSWLLNVPDVPLAEIVELVKAHPKARFILLNGIGYTRCPLGRKDNTLPSNYAIELSRLSAVLANELGQLITNLGAERVIFGTGMPFKYPDPVLVKLEVLDASEADKEKIRSQNAMTCLRLYHRANTEGFEQCKERRIVQSCDSH